MPSCLETFVNPSRNFSFKSNPSYHSNRSSTSHRQSLDERLQSLAVPENVDEESEVENVQTNQTVHEIAHEIVHELDMDDNDPFKSQKSTDNSSLASQKLQD